MFSKPKTGPRKRAYRWYRVKCNECQKEMDADHANTHMKNVHSGKKVKLTPLVETSQSQIHSFFVSGNESNETNRLQEPHQPLSEKNFSNANGNVTESNSSSPLKTGTLTTRTDEHLEKSFTSVMTPVETETPNEENEDQPGLGQNTCVKENTNEFAMVTETGQVTIPTLELPDDDDELLDESLSTEGHSKTTTFNEDDDNHPVEVVASRESESLTIGTVTNIVTNCNDKPNQPMLPEFP